MRARSATSTSLTTTRHARRADRWTGRSGLLLGRPRDDVGELQLGPVVRPGAVLAVVAGAELDGGAVGQRHRQGGDTGAGARRAGAGRARAGLRERCGGGRAALGGDGSHGSSSRVGGGTTRTSSAERVTCLSTGRVRGKP